MKISALLNELIEVEHDTLSGTRAAAARLQNLDHRTQVRKIGEAHARHAVTLSAVVRGMGTVPWMVGDQCLVVSKAKVIFAQRGGDQAILWALRDSERGIIAAHALLLSRPLSARLRGQLEDHQRDALRSFQWLDGSIEVRPTTGILLRFPTVSLEENR